VLDCDDGLDKDDVWYPDANACVTDETPEDGLGSCLSGNIVGRDAVAIDRRERTRSNGYVVQTEVIPASAPLASLVVVSRSLVPCSVNH